MFLLVEMNKMFEKIRRQTWEIFFSAAVGWGWVGVGDWAEIAGAGFELLCA